MCDPYGPLRNPMSRYRTMMKMSALLVGLVLASGCGSGDSATAPKPVSDPPRPTTIAVSPFATELTALGETVQLTAEVRDQNARVMPTATVTWSSSNTSVVTVDQAGLVTAVSTGTAAITASAGPASASAGITVTAPPLSDRDILVALYEATDGSNWINSENWLTDAPLGAWYGVKTDAFGRVVWLDLAGRWDREAERFVEHGLSGSIPPALGNLTHLEELRLRANDLTGPIPPELGRLTRLQELNLHANGLTGPIPPELGKLRSLRRLFLFHNDLRGPIPPELGRLTRLTELNLWGNDLTGPIPPELGKLPSLQELNLHANGLTGPIPPELGKLTSLRRLFLFHNDLRGPIPPELGNLTSLTEIIFHTNGLTGPIPPELGNLPSLRRLLLWGNDLTGPIPPELGNLTPLEDLLLHANNLAGPIPPELGELPNLTRLALYDNDLSGMIPQSFLALDMLNLFQFQGNAGLCVPSTAAFRTWLQGIQDVSGPFCAASASTSN